MEKTPTDISTGESLSSTTTTEERTLRDVVYGSKRAGGNYGSLSKSQTQPTFHISHKVESNDTLQRLALKYSINIQEIKRVNKLWSDAELGLREHINIPVNSTQLTELRNLYPNLEIVQNASPVTTHHQKTSTTDETSSVIRSSDSSNTIPTTNDSPYQDYLSKMDQRIQLTKDSLQSLESHLTIPSTDMTNSSENNRTTMNNNDRHKGVHHLSDNSVFVNISTQNSRDKHVSAALKRIQQEQDNFDEL
jgi:LysM repeat protein